VLDSLGDLAGAKQMHEQALQAFNEVGDKPRAAATLGNLAGSEEQGDLAGAKQRFEQALQVDQPLSTGVERLCALWIAGVLIQQDKLVEARQKSEQALRSARTLRTRPRFRQSGSARRLRGGTRTWTGSGKNLR